MRQRGTTVTAGFLATALLPLAGAMAPPAAPAPDPPARVAVAIARPLAAIDGQPLVSLPPAATRGVRLPEPGLLVLVGSALLGLGTIVRKATGT